MRVEAGHPEGKGASRLLVLALVPLLGFVLSLSALLSGGLPSSVEWPWIPSLGITLDVTLDGLALQFLLLITGIGTLVFVYAAGYLASDPRRVRMFVLLLFFMAAMVGTVVVDDLLALFVFWELTSLASFLLVGFKHELESSRRAARQALLVTAGGGLVLLAGIVLLGEIAGTYSIQSILEAAPRVREHPLLAATLVCIFLGAFSKSAQWPFHFWLPNAMAAPTPVSAYLHSATMVKLGIYLLARLNPAFGPLPLWEGTLVTVGALTAVWSMVNALRERDLKRILAWSTVSALGTLIVLIGLPGPTAAAAAATFLLVHALYKAPLFFVAGNVDHRTGTRSIDDLAGMARAMPWTAAAALAAGISMAGLPLSFGYLAKELIQLAKVEGHTVTWVSYATLLASAVTVAVAGVAAIRVFWHRGGSSLPKDIRDAPAVMVAAPLTAALLGMAFGLAPWLTDGLVVESARAMSSMGWDIDPLALRAERDATGEYAALAVISLGLTIYFAWDRLHRILDRLRVLDRFGSLAVYEAAMRGLPALAKWTTARIQSGRLSVYLSMSAGFTVVALGASWVAAWPLDWPEWSNPPWPALGAVAAIAAASLAVCLVRDAFVMLLASGLTGFGSAFLFLFLGAPDLALTQVAVEVAFVVVVAAVILRVRRLNLPPVSADPRLPRALLGIAAGALVAGLLLAATAGEFDAALTRYYGERAVPEAHGRNVVNVIIVDFRAGDTLGEITVVAMTFLAVLPPLLLLRRDRPGAEESR